MLSEPVVYASFGRHKADHAQRTCRVSKFEPSRSKSCTANLARKQVWASTKQIMLSEPGVYKEVWLGSKKRRAVLRAQGDPDNSPVLPRGTASLAAINSEYEWVERRGTSLPLVLRY
ncbi:hypothetical protein J6590_010043 [Homalodisca vitripennis]|nr:hypothetical protein J6590_010043 [Homalodisca vitripennis]